MAIDSAPEGREKLYSKIVAIGDLNGSSKVFWGNLARPGVVDEKRDWSAGNTRLIFLGDILGDRTDDSFEILLNIAKLQQQAENAGGSIEVFAGNHDYFAVSFLLATVLPGTRAPIYRGGQDVWNFFRTGKHDQARGLVEFAEFANNPNEAFEMAKDMPSFKLDRDEILANMRASVDGRALLEAISSMKLVELVDGVLYTHTNVKLAMLGLIEKYGVDCLNEIYQSNLRRVLFSDKLYDMVSEEFLDLVDVFLETGNRESLTEEVAEKMKSLGMMASVHGHSPGQFGARDAFGVREFCIDSGGRDSSVAVVEKNGTIIFGDEVKKVPDITSGIRDSILKI